MAIQPASYLHGPYSFLQRQFQVSPSPGQPSCTQGSKQISSPNKSCGKLRYEDLQGCMDRTLVLHSLTNLNNSFLAILGMTGQPHQVAVTAKLCAGEDHCGHSLAVDNVHNCKSIFFRLYFLASQQLSFKLVRQADICQWQDGVLVDRQQLLRIKTVRRG